MGVKGEVYTIEINEVLYWRMRECSVTGDCISCSRGQGRKEEG